MEERDKELSSIEVRILDRNRKQVEEDQRNDVTLAQCISLATSEAPKEKDGYFFKDELLMHRKFSKEEHNGETHVDRIVVPESYRQEILRLSHTIP